MTKEKLITLSSAKAEVEMEWQNCSGKYHPADIIRETCKALDKVPAAEWGIQWETKEPPKTQDYVLCTTVNAKGRRDVIRGYYSQETRRWVCGMSSSSVIAWAPMPAPYKGE